MPTKAEIAEAIGDLTGNTPDPESMTKDELEAALKQAEAGVPGPDPLEDLRTPGGVTRRKVNRGSTRRINRALENLVQAMDDFCKEIDVQVWITDDEGKRVEAHPLVKDLETQKAKISQQVASFTTP